MTTKTPFLPDYIMQKFNYNENKSYYRLDLCNQGCVVGFNDIEFLDLVRSLHRDENSDKNNESARTKVREVLLSSRYLETISSEQAVTLMELVGKLPNLNAFELNCHHLHIGHYHVALLSAVYENILFNDSSSAPATLTRLKLWNVQIDTNDGQSLLLVKAIQGLVVLDDFSISLQQGITSVENDDNFKRLLYSALSTLPILRKVFIGMGSLGQQHQLRHHHQSEKEQQISRTSASLGDLCLSPSLQALGLDQVALNDSDIASITHALKKGTMTKGKAKTNTTKLLSGGDDEDKSATASMIRVLSLWNTNPLSERSITEVAEMLRVNASLHWLTLKNVGLDDHDCSVLANALKENETVEELVISQNHKITHKGYNSLIQILQSLKNTTLKSIVTDVADDNVRKIMDLYLNLDRSILREFDTAPYESWIAALTAQQGNLSALFYLLCANPSICGFL